jgi:hypothetical protein
MVSEGWQAQRHSDRTPTPMNSQPARPTSAASSEQTISNLALVGLEGLSSDSAEILSSEGTCVEFLQESGRGRIRLRLSLDLTISRDDTPP